MITVWYHLFPLYSSSVLFSLSLARLMYVYTFHRYGFQDNEQLRKEEEDDDNEEQRTRMAMNMQKREWERN